MYPPTPHNHAAAGEISETVILCGDPCRARYIAENYLTDAVCYTQVRGIPGYTGYYQGKPVSVQAHGMGIPSLAIYVTELFRFYGVKRIIRVGSAGAIDPSLHNGDVLVAISACASAPLGEIYGIPGTYAPTASYSLLAQAVSAIKDRDLPLKVGMVLSDDIFYRQDNLPAIWNRAGVLAVEMETAGLYLLAAMENKQAVSILTITAELYDGGKETDDYTLQSTYDAAIQSALDTAILDVAF